MRELRRVRKATAAMTGVSFTVFSVVSGCADVGRDFRTAAGPAIESGVRSIVDGVLDGLFAVIEPETTTAN